MVPDSISSQVSCVFTSQSTGNHIKTGLGYYAATMLWKLDFISLLVRKFRRALGPIHLGFLRHLLFFSTNGAWACPGQNPGTCKLTLNLKDDNGTCETLSAVAK